ncbi:MAG TPA: response regulator transcription factor [Steroidobacteraceae bacterium]
MAKVLIADDHAVVRAGYRQFLEADSNIKKVGEASSGNDVLDQLRQDQWDVVLLDINMPDRSGLDILRHITAHHPSVSILVMSGLPEELYARNVLRAGAKGYLSKGSDPQELLRAIRLVIGGRRYVSPALAEQMAADLENGRNQDAPLHSLLSTREFQIFCKIAGGATVSEIGAELSLSVKTVSTYRTRILEKMSFKSNADITAYALRNGLIQ